eukprot:CAMPEP_0119547036 /NCGR_PEP_ID=MMETSP1352-20130426/1256_1 /TAXON_ID=265584 /ORGANISM="Stauroneis constricta, Strain CCMP1120" /LENGTH=275 /DNA_ID=CAMNT_0007591843 /DNA_START=277 /DNA_END=1104 /DNA_ORIENTATION=-
MTDTATRHRLTVPTGAETLRTLSSPGVSVGQHHPASGSVSRPTQYLGRLLDFRQMDIQSAMDQMKSLLSTRPDVVYKTSYYRKRTKNHWARDDPAFVALQGVFLVIASIAYSVSFRAPVLECIEFLMYSLLINWLGAGFVIASVGREIANRHLTTERSPNHIRQSVEWLYAFDIHCNAFFPVFVLLYGVQFFLLPIVLGSNLIASIISNTLYAVALSWYWYITHLGYRSLPFLSQTEVFLFPIAAIALIFVLNLVGHFFNLGWNASRVMAHFYFD